MVTVYSSIGVDSANVYFLRDDVEEGVWTVSADCLLKGSKRVKCKPGDRIEIFKETFLEVLSSPSDPDHLLFLLEKALFTGVVSSDDPLVKKLSWNRRCYPEMGLSWKGPTGY